VNSYVLILDIHAIFVHLLVMKKIYRQILLLLSFLAFAIISPIMVLYALGYRLPEKQSSAKPVGVLIIESLPKRADVYIDDEYVGRTPHSEANLPARTISLAVAKEGLTTWQKTIAIKPGIVTETRDIRLFPDKKNLTTLASDIASFNLSPNRSLIAVVSRGNKLSILDEKGEQLAPSLSLLTPPSQMLWSPDSNFILFVINNQTFIVDITNTPLTPRPIPVLDRTTQITWDQRIPGRLHAITPDQNLISYNLATNSAEQVLSDVIQFATSSRYIYSVDSHNQLRVHNLQGSFIKALVVDEQQPIKELHITPGDEVALLFADQSLAYLDKNKALIPIAKSVLSFGWSPDEQLIYLQLDDTSLHVININDERLAHLPLRQAQLVTRLSRPISNPQWFAGGRHIIYQVNDELLVTEIDTRDCPATYQIDSTNLGSAHATVGAHGNVIFYLKKTGTHNRLVSANLTIEE